VQFTVTVGAAWLTDAPTVVERFDIAVGADPQLFGLKFELAQPLGEAAAFAGATATTAPPNARARLATNAIMWRIGLLLISDRIYSPRTDA
jgi:hypothetical protein